MGAICTIKLLSFTVYHLSIIHYIYFRAKRSEGHKVSKSVFVYSDRIGGRKAAHRLHGPNRLGYASRISANHKCKKTFILK